MNDMHEIAPGKRVTMKDVARAAHVATSTVSRALNRPGRTHPYTAQHVLRIAQQLGYVNENNQDKKPAQPTKRLAVVADIRNAALVSALHHSATRAKYQLLFLDSSLPLPEVGSACHAMINQVDGFLIDSEKRKVELNAFVEHQPILWLNRETRKYDVILPDVYKSLSEIIKLLQSRTGSRLAYLYDSNQGWIADECLKTVLKASKQHGIKVDLISDVANNVEAGFKAQTRWRKRSYKEVIIFGTMAAIGFTKAIRRRNANIFNTVSVLGIGDTHSGLLSSPALSTLEIPQEKLAKAAVCQILETMNDNTPRERKVKKIPLRLIRRESTKNWW